MDGTKNKKNKNVTQYCRVERLASRICGLSEHQKSLVRGMGAGFVFTLATNKTLHPDITNFVVENFNCDREALEIEEGNFIEIRPLIKELYDMPDKGTKINLGDPVNRSERLSKLVKKLDGCNETMLWNLAKEPETSDKDFCALFMLGLSNLFLAPGSSQRKKLDTSLLPHLMDHEKIKDLDWCTFIADVLIAGLRKRGTTQSVEGCLHALHLICVDHVTNAEPLPVGTPRSAHITDKHLQFAVTQLLHLKKSKPAGSGDVESMGSSPHSFPESSRNKKDCAEGDSEIEDDVEKYKSLKLDAISNLRATLLSGLDYIKHVTDPHVQNQSSSSYHTEPSPCNGPTMDAGASISGPTGTSISGPTHSSGGDGSFPTTDASVEDEEEGRQNNVDASVECEEKDATEDASHEQANGRNNVDAHQVSFLEDEDATEDASDDAEDVEEQPNVDQGGAEHEAEHEADHGDASEDTLHEQASGDHGGAGDEEANGDHGGAGDEVEQAARRVSSRKSKLLRDPNYAYMKDPLYPKSLPKRKRKRRR